MRMHTTEVSLPETGACLFGAGLEGVMAHVDPGHLLGP